MAQSAIRITPRVRSFQAGGVMPDDQQGSMLFPPLAQPPAQAPDAAAPPAAPPAPVLQIGGTPTPAGEHQPPAVTEQPYDENIELDKAQREDAPILRDRVLSHFGDNRFLTPQPERPTRQSIMDSPEWQNTETALDYLHQNSQGQKSADVTKALSIIERKRKDLITQAEKNYTDQFNKWKMQEAEQLKGATGDKAAGSPLREDWATTDQQRDLVAKALEAQKTTPKGALEYAGAATTTMKPSAFNEAAMRIGQLNNLPPERSTEILMHLAGPNGQYNKRNGAAAANYRLAGRDVIGNVWLDTENGKVRVPPSVYEQIEMARVKGHRALRALEKEQASKPKTRSFGEWTVDQFR
jgi:hypothetical protein